ncbi:MAG: THUMP domain-containing protein [Deltaproteobacteria bacterium]|nr:THUMP domain-containing protein [Deltaproteobacteria bacterium]
MRFFATCAKGLEPLVADELVSCGATWLEPTRAGVAFEGELEVAYRAVLWSRVASRVLLPLASFAAATPAALYDGVAAIDWTAHVAPKRTIAVDATTTQSAIAHSHYAALKTKDAIVDRLRARRGARPDVDVERPDVRMNVHLQRDRATVSLDLSGSAQHQRGYRGRGAPAPLKESLAAAVLLLADWPARAAARQPLMDPMCGSGTLALEAAMIAADVAPGLRRAHLGCVGWAGHDAALWQRLRHEADERGRAAGKRRAAIIGCDADGGAIRAAESSAQRAGLAGRVRFSRTPLADCAPPAGAAGVVVTNPPYGVRLGDEGALAPLYAQLGDVLRRRFLGWTAFVLTGSAPLAKQIGLRPARRTPLWNGAIECRLLEFPISTAPTTVGARWRQNEDGEHQELHHRDTETRRGKS